MLKAVACDILHTVRRTVGTTAHLSREDAWYLSKIGGVIQVGANTGQERFKYDFFDLDVVWVEPLPSVFGVLTRNTRRFPKQRAFQQLLSDIHGREYDFHVASNMGAASSLLAPAAHMEMFPRVSFAGVIKITGTTLDRLVDSEKLDLSKYQALVLDTQGSELLVLEGAAQTLGAIRYIKTEGCDFESYAGGCTIDQITSFLAGHGFGPVQPEGLPIGRRVMTCHEAGGDGPSGRNWCVVGRRLGLPELLEV